MKNKQLALGITATLISLVILLAAGEIMVRISNFIESQKIAKAADPVDPRIYSRMQGEVGLYRPDETMGWTLNKSVTMHQGHVDFDVVYHTDDKGNRITTDGNPQGIKINTYGDSFTFGIGMTDDQTWQSMLNRLLPNTLITNRGVSGYSPDQYFLSLLQDLQNPAEKPEIVIFGILPANDFPDLNYSLIRAASGLYKKPFLVKKENSFEFLYPKDNTRPAGKDASLAEEIAETNYLAQSTFFKKSELLRFLYRKFINRTSGAVADQTDSFNDSKARFDYLVKEAQKLPVKTVYMMIPSVHLALGEISEKVTYEGFIDVLKANNANYIDMRDHIPRKPGYYWAEGHWNIQGAEVVSKALQEHLTKTVLK